MGGGRAAGNTAMQGPDHSFARRPWTECVCIEDSPVRAISASAASPPRTRRRVATTHAVAHEAEGGFTGAALEAPAAVAPRAMACSADAALCHMLSGAWDWRPPHVRPLRESNSWLYVPLLLGGAQALCEQAVRAWEGDLQLGAWWRTAVAQLQTAQVPAGLLLQDLQLYVVASGVCSPAANARAALEPLLPDAGQNVCLAEVLRAVAGSDGYIAGEVQELLLQRFGGQLLCQEVLALSDRVRDGWPHHRPHPPRCAAESPIRTVGRPCFRVCPDQEVEWWVDRLMQMPSADLGLAWRQLPLYSEYVQEHALEEVAHHALEGVSSCCDFAMLASQAVDMCPRLGATCPLPLAVLEVFCARTTAKPPYFLHDLGQALLANLLHAEVCVQPYPGDSEFLLKPRFWALPTGDTAAGKSPSYSLLTKMYTEFLHGRAERWPWASLPDANLHSDGTHGKFNELMRDTAGHVAFVGPEAVNYLSPQYPSTGNCDTSRYVDLPRLLELASGGRYVWGTATEHKSRRAARSAEQTAALPTAATDGLGGRDLVFPCTNVNVCWFQQLDILRQWWATAESKRHLGFAGRFLISCSSEVAVAPGCRREGGRALRGLLHQVWEHVLEHWGPKRSTARTVTLDRDAAHVWEACLYQGMAGLRAQRGSVTYPVQAAMGKWEAWAATVAFMCYAVELSLSSADPGPVLSQNSLKCAMRFLDLRLLHGASVLGAETAQLHPTKTGHAATGNAATQETVAAMRRAIPESTISCSLLSARMTAFRRRPGETTESWDQRRTAVLRAAEGMGLGIVETTPRKVALRKATWSPQLDAVLQMLAIPRHHFPQVDQASLTHVAGSAVVTPAQAPCDATAAQATSLARLQFDAPPAVTMLPASPRLPAGGVPQSPRTTVCEHQRFNAIQTTMVGAGKNSSPPHPSSRPRPDSWHVWLREHAVDFGSSLAGHGCACVPLHIAMSLEQTRQHGSCFNTMQRRIVGMAQGRPLDMAPWGGGPLDLHALHCKIFHRPSWFALMPLGLATGTSALPVAISVEEQHCVLLRRPPEHTTGRPCTCARPSGQNHQGILLLNVQI